MSNHPSDPPEDPHNDGLEQMFAAEEAAIRDDGFSARVVEQARDGVGFRRTIIYGAGMAGFGAAVAGIMEMAPYLPKMSGWWTEVSAAVQASGAPDLSSPVTLIVAATLAGMSFLALAAMAQTR